MSDKHTVASRGKEKGRDNDTGSVNNTSGGNVKGGGLTPYDSRSLRRGSQEPLKGRVRGVSPITSFLNQITLSKQGELHLRTQTVQAIQDKAQHKDSKASILCEQVHTESSQHHTQNIRRSATADPSSPLKTVPNRSSTQHPEHKTVQDTDSKAYDILEPLYNDILEPLYNGILETLHNDILKPLHNHTLEQLNKDTLEPFHRESITNHTQNESPSTAAIASSSLGTGSSSSFSQHEEHKEPAEILPLLPLLPLARPSSLLPLPHPLPERSTSLNAPKDLHSSLTSIPSAQVTSGRQFPNSSRITYMDVGTQTDQMDPTAKISPIRLAILQEEEAMAQFRHVGAMGRRQEFLAAELQHQRDMLELPRYAIFREAQRVVAPAGAAPVIGQGQPNVESAQEPINREPTQEPINPVEPRQQVNGRDDTTASISSLEEQPQALQRVQSESHEARGEQDQGVEELAIDHANVGSGTGSRTSTTHAHGKHLTCYFWHHGQCRKSAAECSYAHYDTGIVATSPGEIRKRKRDLADDHHDDHHYRPRGGYRLDDSY
ncbi:MAG: hypothetical protein Q9212_003087 [Teloschistes hypoglaucus]